MDAVSSGVDMAMGAFSKSWLEKYARQELGGLIEAAVDRAVSLNFIALPVRTMSINKHTQACACAHTSQLKRYRARLQSRMGSQRALQSRSVIAGGELVECHHTCAFILDLQMHMPTNAPRPSIHR